jgi:hypothetical protein
LLLPLKETFYFPLSLRHPLGEIDVLYRSFQGGAAVLGFLAINVSNHLVEQRELVVEGFLRLIALARSHQRYNPLR